jgi:arginine N-succinyltransferase
MSSTQLTRSGRRQEVQLSPDCTTILSNRRVCGSTMFLLREVRPTDLDDLFVLAEKLNTLNLPAHRATLRKIIRKSRASFSNVHSDLRDREYVFVLVDLERRKTIGTSMIIAQHGTFERPAVYFNVRKKEKYSPRLKKHFIHQILELTFNYDGPTEIGGLILDPSYRGHPLRLGKLLSFVRFFFIGMHPAYFRDNIVAELLPPLNDDGTSDLWNCLGHTFTGLDYIAADRLSRENVDFIRNLFPASPIYTGLLPHDVQAMIGTVGAKTAPVEKMLRSIGFENDNSIDPFDGGPTYSVRTRDCDPTRRTEYIRYAGPFDWEEQEDGYALLGFEYESRWVRFRATYGAYKRTKDGVYLRADSLHELKLKPGDRCGFLPLYGPGFKPLDR